MSSRARGSAATTDSAVSRSTATCSASLSSSKSRTIVRIVAVPAPPSTEKTWMKPSRPEVASGVRSDGSAARIRPASVEAFTSLPVAKPGCTSTPWMTRSAPAAVNVSSWSSPTVEPSSV